MPIEMDNVVISVVIPTFNCGQVLPHTLRALGQQSLPTDFFEIIVVDDGSTDDTLNLVRSLDLPLRWSFFSQKNQGAAVARNRGATMSHGDLLVFIDSDVIPDRQLLQNHLYAHHRHFNTLVVGRTRASAVPEKQSVFYQVMGEIVFAFDLGDEECYIPFKDLISRNLSMSKSVFMELGGFDEQYLRSGFEDTEFALRAVKAGYKLLYSSTASGEHRHFGDLEQVGQHMYDYQISAAMLFSQHPKARGQIPHLRDKEPIAWGKDSPRLVIRKIMRWVFSLPPVFWSMRKAVNIFERMHLPEGLMRILYWQVLGTYLYRGYRVGRKRYGLDN
jgi:glycosyltransferase involved in cell wall biosynthesis